MPVEHRVGKVGGTVTDDGHRAALRVGQLPVLGPHVVGLGRHDLAPARCIGKDGVGGVGMHMDLEDVRHRARPPSEPPKACIACRTSLAGGSCSPADQHFGAELEVPLGGHSASAAGEKSDSPA